MEQVNLSLEEIYRNRAPKTFFIPLINGTWQPMYPPRYLEGDIHYDEGQPIGSGYEQFVADIWVGVVLTLMVLSCLCCMCSCLLYQRFQEWRRKVFGERPGQPNDHSLERESNAGTDVESLPSYTIVSGLPSYEEALEQLKQIRDLRSGSFTKTAEAQENAPQIGPPVEDNSQPPPLFSPLRVDILPTAKV